MGNQKSIYGQQAIRIHQTENTIQFLLKMTQRLLKNLKEHLSDLEYETRP